MHRVLILITGIFFSSSFAIFAQKTDVVVLDNEDYITGEIKKLQYGILTYKTDNAGTLQIEWEHIHRLMSDKDFEIELFDGNQYFGSFPQTDSNRILPVSSENFNFAFNMDSVVKILPVKNMFWRRFSGNVSLGGSYTKASTVGQLNYNSDITYTTRKGITKFTWDGNYTTQTGIDDTKRQDINLSPNWTLQNKWFVSTQAGAQQNSELGLDLRLYIGGGMGKNILQTNRNNMVSVAGLITTREWNNDSTDATTNLEGYFYLYYSIFKYDAPTTDITTNFTFYPSITDWGRVRMQFNLNVAQEIIKNFDLNLTLYDSYDNQPSGGSEKNDWGITLGIGYSFNK